MPKAGFWCWSAAALGAAACSMTAVRGSIDDITSAETFTDTARGSVVDKSGNMTFTTSQGVSCAGRFVYLTTQQARGTFDCGDGQGGPFELARTGDRWAGSGIIGDRGVWIGLGQ
jgi:hypothetical protein